MLEGIVICTALLGCLWLLYLYNRPAEEKDVPSALASKVLSRAPERKPTQSDLIARPAYYGAAPAPQPAMDHTLLFVAATIDTSEPERYSSSHTYGGEAGTSYSDTSTSTTTYD